MTWNNHLHGWMFDHHAAVVFAFVTLISTSSSRCVSVSDWDAGCTDLQIRCGRTAQGWPVAQAAGERRWWYSGGWHAEDHSHNCNQKVDTSECVKWQDSLVMHINVSTVFSKHQATFETWYLASRIDWRQLQGRVDPTEKKTVFLLGDWWVV